MSEPYKDRVQAGIVLAQNLTQYASNAGLLVLGLPRGGVVVAAEVAAALHAELNVFIVRKLGVPYQPELAMGAVAEDGIVFLNDSVVDYFGLSKETIDDAVKQEVIELKRRVELYRRGRAAPKIRGRTVIVVDDGVATGATMKVAIRALRKSEPQKIIVGVPVGAESTCRELNKEADELVCVLSPEPFTAVGSWYLHFEQTSDEEVCEVLEKYKSRYSAREAGNNYESK